MLRDFFDKPLLFRPHAQRVLRDDRRHLACTQIRDHLRQWDGGGRIGKARLWLQVRDYDPPELDGGLVEEANQYVRSNSGMCLGARIPLCAP